MTRLALSPLSLLVIVPSLLMACSPGTAHGPDEAALLIEADDKGMARTSSSSLVIPKIPEVDGFRYAEGEARLSISRASSLSIETQHNADPSSGRCESPASTWWDSSWASSPDAKLLDPRRFTDCVRDGDGYTCTLDSFVARPGRSCFTARAVVDGRSVRASWSTVFHAIEPRVELLSRSPDGHGALLEMEMDGSIARVVQLSGSARERGYAQGWLLEEDIVGMLESLLTTNFQSSHQGKLVQTHFGPICYDHIPIRTAYDSLRRNIADSQDLPAEVIEEMQGVLDGMADRNEGRLPTITLAGTPECPETTLEVGLEDLLVLNSLDEFCRSFTIWGDRAIDASNEPGKGTMLATSIEWTDALAPYNYLFVHLPDEGLPFVHASWAGFIVAYGPMMNKAGVATAGIMSNPGRLSYGGDMRTADDFWYKRLYLHPETRSSVASEVRRAVSQEADGAEALASVSSALAEYGTFTNHSVTFQDADGLVDGAPQVLEAHYKEGVGARTEGTCDVPGACVAVDFPFYQEDDYLASTWCAQLLHESSSHAGDPDYHCQDGISGGHSYEYSDDYDRIGAMLDRGSAGMGVTLADANRTLYNVSEETGLLHFAVFLPEAREMLIGMSREKHLNGGTRDNQLYLSFEQLAQEGWVE